MDYDIGAFIWPSYHPEPRARIFWPKGMGEWERVLATEPKFPGHNQPRKPLWGCQDEADPRIMEMQIDAAADHRVNVFIYDWYWYDRRPFLEGCLNNGYLGARNNHRVKHYIMWANHDATTLWDIRNSHDPVVLWQAGVDRAEFDRMTDRIIRKYLPHPSYYRLEDRPVFAIYDIPTLITGLGGVKETREALFGFRNRVVQAGLPGLHLQAMGRRSGSTASGIPGEEEILQSELFESLGFDSVTFYQWCHLAKPIGDYKEWGRAALREAETCARGSKLPSFPHVSIGWDNNARFVGLKEDIVTGATPGVFRTFLLEAKQIVDEGKLPAPLITINSWNEWTESSYLLPDHEWGYGYLEAVRDVFG